MIFDVLVVGGGPSGSTTALLLAQAGFSVGLIEKKAFPRSKVCGEFISATSMPLLKKLGVDDFYLTQAGPEVKRVGFYAADTIIRSNMPNTHSWGRALGREHLDTELLNRARESQVQIWQPFAASNIERRDGLFICRASSRTHTEEVKARLIVLAHGSWEKAVLDPRAKIHKSTDLLAFKAHFRNTNLPQDLMPLLAFSGGYGGMVHTDNQRVTLSCCIRRSLLEQLRIKKPGLQAGEVVAHYIKNSCLGVRQALSGAEIDGHWLAAGPIHPGIRTCYKDSIFFVGNCVGEAHPVIAEGISMAMQSAWLLSQILIQRKNQELAELGACYQQQWNKYFKNRLYAASCFAKFAMLPSPAMSLFLPLLKQFPGILTLGARLSGKIHEIKGDSQ